MKRDTQGQPIVFMTRVKSTSQRTVPLHGLLYRAEHAQATVITAHWYGARASDLAHLTKIFDDRFNVLTFSFRAHGPNAHVGRASFGNKEHLDVLAAVEFVKAHSELKHLPLLAFGCSMGTAALLEVAGTHPTLFDALVLDSPYDSADNLVRRGVAKIKLTVGGRSWTIPGLWLLAHCYRNGLLQRILIRLVKRFSGSSDHAWNCKIVKTRVEPVFPEKRVCQVRCPVMIIGCVQDEYVPSAVFRMLYERVCAYKRLWLTAGNRHGDSYFFNPCKYVRMVNEFFMNVVSGVAAQAVAGTLDHAVELVHDESDVLVGEGGMQMPDEARHLRDTLRV